MVFFGSWHREKNLLFLASWPSQLWDVDRTCNRKQKCDNDVNDECDDFVDYLIFSSVSLGSLYMLSLSHKPQKFLKSISDFVQF